MQKIQQALRVGSDGGAGKTRVAQCFERVLVEPLRNQKPARAFEIQFLGDSLKTVHWTVFFTLARVA